VISDLAKVDVVDFDEVVDGLPFDGDRATWRAVPAPARQ
jgi:hypothetical protein